MRVLLSLYLTVCVCVGAYVCVFNTHKSKTFTYPTPRPLTPSWPSTINCWHASFSSFPIPAHALPTKFIYLRLSLILYPPASSPPSPLSCLLSFNFGFCLWLLSLCVGNIFILLPASAKFKTIFTRCSSSRRSSKKKQQAGSRRHSGNISYINSISSPKKQATKTENVNNN